MPFSVAAGSRAILKNEEESDYGMRICGAYVKTEQNNKTQSLGIVSWLTWPITIRYSDVVGTYRRVSL